jgi:hypothetical protein
MKKQSKKNTQSVKKKKNKKGGGGCGAIASIPGDPIGGLISITQGNMNNC